MRLRKRTYKPEIAITIIAISIFAYFNFNQDGSNFHLITTEEIEPFVRDCIDEGGIPVINTNYSECDTSQGDYHAIRR